MKMPMIETIEELTNEAVPEIFKQMLGLEIKSDAPKPLDFDPTGQIVSSVGFIGQANGVICLYAGLRFAKVITGKMLGLAEAAVDSGDMVNDAVGELSNMVVGRVKSRLCDRGWSCTLTIPSIVRGQQLSVEGTPSVTRKVLGFVNCENRMLAEILIKETAV